MTVEQTVDQKMQVIVGSALRALGYNKRRVAAFGGWSWHEIYSTVSYTGVQPGVVLKALEYLAAVEMVRAVQFRGGLYNWLDPRFFLWVDKQAYDEEMKRTERQRAQQLAKKVKAERKAKRTYGRTKSDKDAATYRWPESGGQLVDPFDCEGWATRARWYGTNVAPQPEEELDFEV
jgi:hypothetical protein